MCFIRVVTKGLWLGCFYVMCCGALYAQEENSVPRPLTMDEYKKAKTFEIKDLDNQTYLKVENTYILDRYEMRKPYFITGDDRLKKRIDLYKLYAKEEMQELGMVIFYTNEKGKVYTACLPNFTAAAEVWDAYFNDIHAINKVEENFVLKLAYILSKEMSFQLYKAMYQGKDFAAESVTYGNDICFPGDEVVTLADGQRKRLEDIGPGDAVMTIDPVSGKKVATVVKGRQEHEAKNYAITRLTLYAAQQEETPEAHQVRLRVRTLRATPNHPVATSAGERLPMGSLQVGQHLLCYETGRPEGTPFEIIGTEEITEGVQKVYNLITTEGDNFMVNDMLVMKK